MTRSAAPDADAAFSPSRIWWDSVLTGGRIFLVAASALTFTYLAARHSLVQQSRSQLRAVAESAAALMDPSLQRQLLDAEDLGSPTYRRATEPLLKLRRAIPEIYYAYGLMPDSGGRLRFTVDTSHYIQNPGDHVTDIAHPGELYDDAPLAARQALRNGVTTVSEEPYTDKWGTFLSAFAPVKNGDPQAGFVGVDISLKTLNRLLQPLQVTLLVSLAGSAALALAAAYDNFRSLRAQAGAVRELARARILAEAAAAAADSANRAKSTFLATVSHEIRTPLNGVLGLTAIVLDSELTPSQRECLQTVQRSGEALLAVLNDVLDFSKIEAGRLELELRATTLRPLLEDVLDICSTQAQTKGLELALLLEPGVPISVVTDPTRLRQILLNLVGNAVKFTAEGEVVIEVDVVDRHGDGRFELAFTISDTGVGIPEDRRDRLFRPFSQVDASTTRRHGGTGLGLVISQRLVEALGGTIELVSSDGAGTVFRFTIVAEATGVLAPSGPEILDSLAGRRLLVVMANRANQRILKRLTAAWGLHPIFTSTGSEALAELDQNGADLALVDRRLSDMEGPALAAALRAHPRGASVPLILLSLVGERLDCPEAFGILTKPIKEYQLQKELLRALTPPAAAPASGAAAATPGDASFARSHPLRILVAEDNAVNRRVCELLFQRLGYSVAFAVDGPTAVERQAALDPDLILMDVQMPGLDGHEATRRIRRRTGRPDRPWIVALTADALASDRSAAFESGMNDFLSKPIDSASFRAAILRARAALESSANSS